MDTFVFLLVHLALVASDPDVLRQRPGKDVTLKCQAADVSIRAVEWTRDDLKPPEYILFYTNGRSDPTYQLSSFENRVQLANRELKNGDVSLILRNVSVNDSGLYECRVADGRSGRKKRAIIDDDPIRRIKLVVTDSGAGNHNHVGLAPVFGPVGLAVLGLVVVVLVRKSKRHTNKESEQTAADEAVGDQLI